MLPGNYARCLFDDTNKEHVLFLVSNEDRKEKISQLSDMFHGLRTIYRAKNPKVQFLDETKSYKENAVKMGRFLLSNFAYARWNNYLHKGIEHVDEIIDTHGSVGVLSGEGNEAGNKLFKHLRKHHSRKNDAYGSLIDCLKVHTLYSGKKLQLLSKVAHKKYICKNCGQAGHNRITCTISK